MGHSQHNQNIPINSYWKNEKCLLFYRKKLNRLFGPPIKLIHEKFLELCLVSNKHSINVNFYYYFKKMTRLINLYLLLYLDVLRKL